eukprot:scaffold134914_cov14-Tisochrysis_lutea.AAC.1
MLTKPSSASKQVHNSKAHKSSTLSHSTEQTGLVDVQNCMHFPIKCTAHIIHILVQLGAKCLETVVMWTVDIVGQFMAQSLQNAPVLPEPWKVGAARREGGRKKLCTQHTEEGKYKHALIRFRTSSMGKVLSRAGIENVGLTVSGNVDRSSADSKLQTKDSAHKLKWPSAWKTK